MTTLRDIMASISISIDSIETILDDLVNEDMTNYDAETLDLIECLGEVVDSLKHARNKVKNLDEKCMPGLIDQVLSIVINHPGISTTKVGMMANVDLMDVTGVLIRLWSRQKIEGKVGPNGVIRWYWSGTLEE